MRAHLLPLFFFALLFLPACGAVQKRDFEYARARACEELQPPEGAELAWALVWSLLCSYAALEPAQEV